MSRAAAGVLACPSWCDTYGQHDDVIAQHSRRLLHAEQGGILITVWLAQTVERYDRPTPGGGRSGRVQVGAPKVCIMWERDPDEYNVRMFDLAPGVAELLAPVLEAMFGVNVLATALAHAARLAEDGHAL